MSNVFMTDPVFISTPVLLAIRITDSDNAISNRIAYFDAYMASVFGFLQIKLFQLYDSVSNKTKLCLPIGIYRIALLGYAEFRAKDAYLQVDYMSVSSELCSFDDNQTLGE